MPQYIQRPMEQAHLVQLIVVYFTFAALLPRSRERQARTTRPPCLATAVAVASPIPALPPVMIHVCVFNEGFCITIQCGIQSFSCNKQYTTDLPFHQDYSKKMQHGAQK